MSEQHRHASFTAYDRGGASTPADFAPIRAELRHASRNPEETGAEQLQQKRRLRWVVLTLALLTGTGILAHRYYGILADFTAERVAHLAELEIGGRKLADVSGAFQLPEFQRPAINRPINTVRVESPLHQVTEDEVRTLLARYTESGFLGVDVQDLRDELERNPWIADASVRRVWPDVLAIRIEEETPIAIWGDAALLNKHREAFVAPLREPLDHLPRLSGPDGAEEMVVARYQKFSERLIEDGMTVASMSVDERGSWRLKLSDGPELRLGREQVEARLERFIAMYTTDLREQLADAGTVDLRYRNGFSVSAANVSADSVASR